MSVIRVVDEVDPELGRQLDEFEHAFEYPLGPNTSFRISHTPDYLRFYRAMGPAALFVAVDQFQVRGTVSVAIRQAFDQDSQSLNVAYFGDLKVRPGNGRGHTAARLLQAAAAWALARATQAVAVVMTGTSVLPDAYSGRVGIPLLQPLAPIAILRFPVTPERTGGSDAWPRRDGRDSADSVAGRFRELVRGAFALRLGDARQRSRMEPWPLLAHDGQACGYLEDTRQAKRLFLTDGDELVSAHLSQFAYRQPSDGAALVRAAQACAAAEGVPGLFVAVDAERAADLLAAWSRQTHCATEVVARAGAMVYGFGLPMGASWHMNTAEI